MTTIQNLDRIKEIFMGKLLFLEFHNGVKSFLWNQFQLSQWNIQTRQGLYATIENKTNDCQAILKIIQYIVINSPIQTSGMHLHEYRNTIAAISHAFQNYMIYLEFGFDCGNLMQDVLLTCFNGLLRNLWVPPPLNDVLNCFHESGMESANNACQ